MIGNVDDLNLQYATNTSVNPDIRLQNFLQFGISNAKGVAPTQRDFLPSLSRPSAGCSGGREHIDAEATSFRGTI